MHDSSLCAVPVLLNLETLPTTLNGSDRDFHKDTAIIMQIKAFRKETTIKTLTKEIPAITETKGRRGITTDKMTIATTDRG